MKKLLSYIDTVFFKVAIAGISLFFIVFLVDRAIVATFTFDEAATYLNYISAGPTAVFNLNSANNHLVNTLLTKFFSALGGNSEFVLRLPNLLAFVVYLLFSFLILNRFVKNKILIVFGYFLLAANPYVLDFFSLCRGYGLSLAFLMAALFFFFSFLDMEADHQPDRYRRLQFSLIAGGLAVLSNFNLLNVYLSLVLIVFVVFVVWNRQNRLQSPLDKPRPSPSKKKRIFWSLCILAAVLFNILEVSRALLISKNLYEPVAVQITGLSEPDKQYVDVFRMDINNRQWRLIYKGDIWTLDVPVYFSAIKFRCLPNIMDKIKRIDIRIGQKAFAYEAHHILKIKDEHPHRRYFVFYSDYSVSLKRSLFPVFKPVINWKGDRIFFFYFLGRMLLLFAIDLVFFTLLYLLGLVLKRRHILTHEQFRPLAWTTFGLAAFIGYPLYFLKKSGEFYWGGRTGFIRDTLISLINNSFYGNLYFHRQEWVIFFLVCLAIFGFLILLFVHYRKRSLAKVLPGMSVFAILVVVSISTIVQRALFDNPYLTGRTGLFLIPLFTLLLIFLFRELCLGRTALKIISISFLGIMTLLAFYHFSERANTAMTVEWRDDADTKDLLKDLKTMKDKDFPERSKISLGIDEFLYPSFAYYEKRGTSAWLEVDTVPPYPGHDFYYLEGNFDHSAIILIKSYPLSGNLLAKAKNK